jgi:hypothetical protein
MIPPKNKYFVFLSAIGESLGLPKRIPGGV